MHFYLPSPSPSSVILLFPLISLLLLGAFSPVLTEEQSDGLFLSKCIWFSDSTFPHVLIDTIQNSNFSLEPNRETSNVLRPGASLLWRCMNVGTATSPTESIFRLEGLHSNRFYEILISRPAIMPASFELALISERGAPLAPSTDSGTVPGSRDLLDTEKIMFRTGSSSSTDNNRPSILGFKGVASAVRVRASGIAVPRQGHAAPSFVAFNIELQELIGPGIPPMVIRLLIVAIPLLCGGAWVALIGLPRLAFWLASDPHKRSS